MPDPSTGRPCAGLHNIAQAPQSRVLAQLDPLTANRVRSCAAFRGIGRRSSQRCTNHFARPVSHSSAIPSNCASALPRFCRRRRRHTDRASAGKRGSLQEGDPREECDGAKPGLASIPRFLLSFRATPLSEVSAVNSRFHTPVCLPKPGSTPIKVITPGAW